MLALQCIQLEGVETAPSGPLNPNLRPEHVVIIAATCSWWLVLQRVHVCNAGASSRDGK